eukprot:3219797-Rhodomonas_salina.1
MIRRVFLSLIALVLLACSGAFSPPLSLRTPELQRNTASGVQQLFNGRLLACRSPSARRSIAVTMEGEPKVRAVQGWQCAQSAD